MDRVTPGGGGADIEPSVQAGRMPSMSYDGAGDYFLIHHTQADTVDKIEPVDVARAAAAIAVMAYVVADLPARRRTYYGWGSSKFGPWRLRGSAYVDVRIRPSEKNPDRLAYDVRVRTAPVNAMVNAIMRLGLFKGYVIGQIEATMKDLVGAAAALSPQNLDRILTDPGFSPEELDQVRALAALQD